MADAGEQDQGEGGHVVEEEDHGHQQSLSTHAKVLHPEYFTMTEDQHKTFEEFKTEVLSQELDEYAREFCDDQCLARFLKARQFNKSAAKTMINECIQWRHEHLDGKDGRCKFCLEDDSCHCFHPIGVDIHKRVMVYANQARAKMQGFEEARDHMVNVLERCFALDGVAQQWVWIVDFNGFSIRHALMAKVAMGTLHTFSNNYPERLGLLLLLNPPAVFKMMWAAVRPFLDPVTAKKIVFVRGEQEVETLFSTLIDNQEMVEWIKQAMSMKSTPGNLPPFPSSAPKY